MPIVVFHGYECDRLLGENTQAALDLQCINPLLLQDRFFIRKRLCNESRKYDFTWFAKFTLVAYE